MNRLDKILKAIEENGEDTNIFFIQDLVKEIKAGTPEEGQQRLGQRLWNNYVKNYPEIKDHYGSFHKHVFYMSNKEFYESIKEDMKN